MNVKWPDMEKNVTYDQPDVPLQLEDVLYIHR